MTSADAELIAYASNRSGRGDLDIYVQQISGRQPIRLTQNEANLSFHTAGTGSNRSIYSPHSRGQIEALILTEDS